MGGLWVIAKNGVPGIIRNITVQPTGRAGRGKKKFVSKFKCASTHSDSKFEQELPGDTPVQVAEEVRTEYQLMYHEMNEEEGLLSLFCAGDDGGQLELLVDKNRGQTDDRKEGKVWKRCMELIEQSGDTGEYLVYIMCTEIPGRSEGKWVMRQVVDDARITKVLDYGEGDDAELQYK